MKHGFFSRIAAENIKKNTRLYVPRILAEAGLLGCFYILLTLSMDRRMSDALGGAYLSAFMGFGAIVIGLAAVIIGEVPGEAILGKHLNFALRLTFTAAGAVIYYMVITFVLWLGLPSENMKLFSAIVVAIFLAVPYLKGKYNSSFARVARKGAKS